MGPFNRSVIDPKDHKIGVLEAIYVETSTDEPAMATVRMGCPPATVWRSCLLFLVLLAAVLGVIGAAAEGPGCLLFIGIALLVAALAYAGVRWSRRAGRHPATDAALPRGGPIRRRRHSQGRSTT